MKIDSVGTPPVGNDRTMEFKRNVSGSSRAGEPGPDGGQKLAGEPKVKKLGKNSSSPGASAKKQVVEHLEHQRQVLNPVSYSRDLSFVKHRPSNSYYVRVIDGETQEVIREIPPPDELDRITKMVKYLKAHFGI
ncbi:MAG: flagellar protein FlaG [Candidatus Krumholzibacteriota bacterium]|nr:flagellar protein FlaG [Candidatus Krumholzibacteriota bacterium]